MFRDIVISIVILAPVIRAADWAPQIPKTWDDAAIASHEIPLADPVGSPKHVSPDYYYRIPVRPIFQGYPVYAAGREPAGYLDWLKQRDPIILWDDKGHAPPLETEADWIRAGEIVFDTPIAFDLVSVADVRNPDWYQKLHVPVARDGTVPEFQYVIRTKGLVEVGRNACANCHTRVMPDGSVLKGAQSNFPVNRSAAWGFRAGAAAPDKEKYLAQLRGNVKQLHAAPWLQPDLEARIDTMSAEEIASVFDAPPPGANLRQRSNSFLPIQVPDLIGVKDRRYLDRTGLELQRDIGDLMRYAAMNQGADRLGNYAGFIPADVPEFNHLPPPEKARPRYSDAQLYALALWLYSLKPPHNPNTFDSLAARGQKVFDRERCGYCHTPPLYTNNKLTPANGFQIPREHFTRYDILQVSVGTDPALTLRTARGTGYYKVPSLRGLWYRGMFPHDGSCATLEDWFDARCLRSDYVPTGFKGYRVEKRAVPGHEFGLNLPAEEKRALIAFLRTL